MQVNSLWIRASVIVIGLLVSQCAMEAASTKPTLIEVWCGGDDGLTIRLKDALEAAFKSTSDFRLSSGKKLGTLIVTIPTHVGWKQAGQRTKVSYAVEFTSIDNRALGTSTGSCWDDALAKCTRKIVNDARLATHKVQ